MTARFIVGDSLTVLRSLPDASVDLVLSSPAFLALRSYLPDDHPDKSKEMGAEPTPGAYIDALLEVVEECRRVLAPHGSLALELGDTYSGSGGAGGDYNEGGLRDGQARFDGSASRAYGTGAAPRPARVGRDRARSSTVQRQGSGGGWPLDKSLCLIPETLRWAMVYGFNPHTGRPTPQWRARNVVRWCRPNPPVGALGDKVRPATSDLLVACSSSKRYFDLDAVREAPKGGREPGELVGNGLYRGHPKGEQSGYPNCVSNPAGAPPLDHWWFDDVFEQDAWLVSTAPYKGSHYATWPPDLLVKPIESMCPRRVCTTCGKPSERIVDAKSFADGKPSTGTLNGRSAVEPWREESPTHQAGRATFSRVAKTTGWTDCGHDSWRPGVVLDPFAGSGTTLAVATGHGRAAIGIDLDERNADLARERVGMWLEVEHFREQPEEQERA